MAEKSLLELVAEHKSFLVALRNALRDNPKDARGVDFDSLKEGLNLSPCAGARLLLILESKKMIRVTKHYGKAFLKLEEDVLAIISYS